MQNLLNMMYGLILVEMHGVRLKKTIFHVLCIQTHAVRLYNLALGICVLLILNLFTSCTDDNYGRQPNELAVAFTASVGVEKDIAVSRASGTAWTVGDQVGIHLTTTGTLGATGFTPYVMQDDLRNLAPAYNDQRLSFPADGSDVRFIAFYPYMDEESLNGTTATYNLTEQSTQEEQEAIDFMYYKDVSKSYNATAYAVDLNFYHKLSRIIVNVRTDDNGISDISNVTVRVIGAPSTVNCSLADGSVTAGTQSGIINMLELNSEVTNASFQAILAPGAATGTFANRELNFEIDGMELYGHPLTTDLKGGYSYTYSFVLEGTEVIFEGITINDWNEVYEGEDDVKNELTLSAMECLLTHAETPGTVTAETDLLGTLPVVTSSATSWLTAEISGSDGVYTISYTATENTTNTTRTAYLTVQAGSREVIYTINQLGPEAIAEASNCIVLTTGGGAVLMPISVVNEVFDYPGVALGRDFYTPPFSGIGTIAFDAKVLWIDSPDFADTELQTTVATDIIAEVGAVCSTLSNSYLRVKPGTKPGNAVVCITSAGTNTILWSWHIWVVSPEERAEMWIKGSPENTITEKPEPTANGYAFFPIALGAFNARGNATKYDSDGTAGWYGHPYVGLYYQWGRKDPLPNRYQPSMIGSVLSSLPYITNRTALTFSKSALYNGLKSITYAYNFSFGDLTTTGWVGTIHLDGVTNNSWGYSSTHGYNRKSPFDPCPAGWRVPPGVNPGATKRVAVNAWKGTGITPDGYHIDAELISHEDHEYGVGGFMSPSGYGGLYPYTQLRLEYLGIYEANVAREGACWGASPATGTNLGYNLGYYDMGNWGNFDEDGSSPRQWGLSVRCVTE